jgi:hypothetical protein
VEGEEARSCQERERDQEEAGIRAAPRSVSRDDRQDAVRDRGGENEPEVRGMVLPEKVEPWRGEQEEEPAQRDRDRGGDPAQSSDSSSRLCSSLAR